MTAEISAVIGVLRSDRVIRDLAEAAYSAQLNRDFDAKRVGLVRLVHGNAIDIGRMQGKVPEIKISGHATDAAEISVAVWTRITSIRSLAVAASSSGSSSALRTM